GARSMSGRLTSQHGIASNNTGSSGVQSTWGSLHQSMATGLTPASRFIQRRISCAAASPVAVSHEIQNAINQRELPVGGSSFTVARVFEVTPVSMSTTSQQELFHHPDSPVIGLPSLESTSG